MRIVDDNENAVFKHDRFPTSFQVETQNVEGTQPTPTNNKNNLTEENKCSQPKLFNLSNTTLSKCQTSILLRGLKFTPTPQSNSIQLT